MGKLFLAPFVALFVILFNTVAIAEPYRPFEFHDPLVSQRKDIEPHYKKQNYDIPLKHQSAMVVVDSMDAAVNLKKEVHGIISSVWSASFRSFSSSTSTPELVNCYKSLDWQEQTLPQLSGVTQCSRLSQLIAATKSANACTHMSKPELFVKDHPSGRVDGDDMYDLEKAIATAGEALMRLEFPNTPELVNTFNRLRVILLKVRKPKLESNVNERLNLLSELNRQANSNKDCFVNPNESAQTATATRQLIDELGAAKLELLRIYQLGLLQAANERVEVIRTGKFRNELPYPALTDLERKELTMLLGAVYWRVRGGGLVAHKGGSQTARKWFVENLTQTLVKLNCGNNCPKEVFKIGGQMRSKLMLKGWGQWFDMGNTQNGTESEDNRDRYYDLTRMTWRGEFQVDNSVSSLKKAKFDANPFLLGGLSMGSCYWYGWNHLKNIYIGETAELPYRHFLHGPTSWGEVCIGGSMYLGLSRSLLAGYKK